MTQTVKNLLAMQDILLCSLDQEDPLENGMATHSIFLPGEFHGQKSLVGLVHVVAKNRTQLKN